MIRGARLTIHQRLLLIALLPAALLTTLVAGIALDRGMAALDDALRARAVGLVSFLAPAAEYGVISGHRGNLAALAQAAIAQPEVSAAAIYNDRGELLASSGRFTVLAPAALRAVGHATIRDASPEALAAIAPVLAEAVNLDDPFSEGAAASPARAQVVGWVHVELDSRPSTHKKNGIIAATLGLALVGLALTAVLGVRLARSISRPVTGLVDGVGKMAAGELDVELAETATNAELAALERGFNAMARAISDVHRTLQSRVDEATAQLAYQAQHDPLTGLPNRRVFEERLDESVAASRRVGDHGALCFLDLDRFKIVNDTCGHAAGDELLRRIAKLIRQSVREQDIVCRIGGDEFALILRGCSPADAHRICEHLREGIAAFRFSWEERLFSVGASIGIALIDGRHPSVSDLLVAADVACYEAKKQGRNQVVEYDEHRYAHGTSPDGGGADTIDAQADYELELHVQTIVPLAPHASRGWVEILLRVRGPSGELHSPHEYLSHFEHEGRGLELDMRVAELGCAAVARLQAGSETRDWISASLNLGRASIRSPAPFLARLRAALAANAVAAQQIVLELPVELVEQFPDECVQFVAEARALGCRIAVQQVDGTGIRRIGLLRPDYAKIGLKGLITKYGLEAGCNLAQALTGMAAALSIPTVASEVEDPALLDSLAAFGFDLAQGNAIAPPAALDAWLAREARRTTDEAPAS